jgi:hypothetical protein
MREKNILTIKMYQIWTRIGSSKDSMTVRLSFDIPNENLSFSISNISNIKIIRLMKRRNQRQLKYTQSKVYT